MPLLFRLMFAFAAVWACMCRFRFRLRVARSAAKPPQQQQYSGTQTNKQTNKQTMLSNFEWVKTQLRANDGWPNGLGQHMHTSEKLWLEVNPFFFYLDPDSVFRFLHFSTVANRNAIHSWRHTNKCQKKMKTKPKSELFRFSNWFTESGN